MSLRNAAPVPGAHGMAVVWRLALATALILMSFSMVGPVIAVLLQQRGHSTALIGAFAMLPFLVIGVLIPVTPRLIARWGVVRAYRVGALLQLAGAIAYAVADDVRVWSIASLVTGAGAAALWNATETLLAQEAPPERRGRVMGLYQTALGASLAVGPLLPGVLQLSGRAVLWLAPVLITACTLVAFGIRGRRHEAAPTDARNGMLQALRRAPMLAGLAFAGGVFEAGLNSVSAAHASSAGFGVAASASVAGAIGIGSFLCQYPAGWAADRFAPRAVYATAAMLLLAASAAFALADRAPWLLWGAGLVWGGVGGALYTLSMVRVAHVFRGASTAGGAAAMITGYTWGGTLGPLASGAALQAGGVAAMAAALSLLALAAGGMALRLRA